MRLTLLTILWTMLSDSTDGGFLVDVWLIRGVCPDLLPRIPEAMAGGRREYNGFSEVRDVHRKTVRVFPPGKNWYDPYIYDTNMDKSVCGKIMESLGCKAGDDDKVYNVFPIPSGILVGPNRLEQQYHLDGIKSQMICFEDDLEPLGIPYIIAKGPVIGGIGPTYFFVDPHTSQMIDFFVYKSTDLRSFKISSFEDSYHLYLMDGPQMNLINRLLHERRRRAKWTVPPKDITNQPDLYRILTGTQGINDPPDEDTDEHLYPSLSREYGFRTWENPTGKPTATTWAVKGKKSGSRPPICPQAIEYPARNYKGQQPSGTYRLESVHTPERSKGLRIGHTSSMNHSPSVKHSRSKGPSYSRDTNPGDQSYSGDQSSAEPKGRETTNEKRRSNRRIQIESDSDGSIPNKYNHEVHAIADIAAIHPVTSLRDRSSASLNSRNSRKYNENVEPSQPSHISDKKKSANEAKSKEKVLYDESSLPTRQRQESSKNKSVLKDSNDYLSEHEHEQSCEYVAPEESATVQLIQLRQPQKNVILASKKSQKELHYN